MKDFSRAAALAGLIATITLTSGCPASPSQVCQRMVDSVDAFYMRCGYNLHTVLTLDGVPSDCHHVTRVTDGGSQILHMCIPWTQNVDCGTVMIDASGIPQLSPTCDFGMLQAR
jgi:hypothetical protein